MFKPGIPVTTFVQATPATSWVVEHNFGMPVIVDTIYLSNGVLKTISPQSVILSADKKTTTITFASAVSGEARVVGYSGPPPIPPTLDPYTTLLLHMDGANGSTAFPDAKGHALYSGTATVSTAASKFGGASAFFNGTSDYLEYNGSDFGLSTANFTLECWVYADPSIGNDCGILRFGNNPGAANSYQFFISRLGSQFYVAGLGGNTITGTFETGVWIHIAVVRTGTSFRIYKNGIDIGGFIDGSSIAGPSLQVGGYYGTSQYLWKGYIDEVRLSKGVARYSANFTPPASAFGLYV
jgi:hypothetical protein